MTDQKKAEHLAARVILFFTPRDRERAYPALVKALEEELKEIDRKRIPKGWKEIEA